MNDDVFSLTKKPADKHWQQFRNRKVNELYSRCIRDVIFLFYLCTRN